MILDHKTLDLFGKMLFEKAVIVAPFKKPHNMADEACFLYVLEGTYNSVSEDEALLIKKDEAVLMKCGNYLSQMRSTTPDKKYEAIAVHFFPEVLKRIYKNEPPAFLRSTSRQASFNMARIEASVLVQKYIESILFYFENPALVSEEILILKLKEIILLLLQTPNAPRVMEIMSNLFNPREFDFKQVIETHLFSTVSISELAALTHRSLSSFKRDFAKIYNDSPGRYIKRKRVEKAANMLKVSTEPIGDIAYQCGFGDTAYFSKTFKSVYGLSPSSFRLNPSDKILNILS